MRSVIIDQYRSDIRRAKLLISVAEYSTSSSFFKQGFSTCSVTFKITGPGKDMSPALSGGYFTTSATWEVDFKWIRFYFFTSPLSLLLSLLFLDSFFIIFCIVRKFEIRHPIPLGIYNAKRCIVYSTLLYALWLLAFNRLWVVSQLIYCEWLTAILKQSFFGHKNKFVQWRFNFHPFYLWVRPIWYSFVN